MFFETNCFNKHDTAKIATILFILNQGLNICTIKHCRCFITPSVKVTKNEVNKIPHVSFPLKSTNCKMSHVSTLLLPQCEQSHCRSTIIKYITGTLFEYPLFFFELSMFFVISLWNIHKQRHCLSNVL